MPISTSCPSCRAPYNLADELAGQTVRCRECKFAFDVPGAPQSNGTAVGISAEPAVVPEGRRLAPPADRDRDRGPGRRRPVPAGSGGSYTPLIIIGVVLGGVFVVCLGIVGFLFVGIFSVAR